ncbi:MAG: hypothetical protein ACXIVE_09315 [Salinarimonas sp.]
MIEDETQGLRKAVTDELEIMFESQVVSQIQGTNARSIAGTAKILQESGVEDVCGCIGIETERPGNVTGNASCTHGVAWRLPLGDVERSTQGYQHLPHVEVGAFTWFWTCIGEEGTDGLIDKPMGAHHGRDMA